MTVLVVLLGCDPRRDWFPVDALPVTAPDPARLARKDALLDALDALPGQGRSLLGQNIGQLDVGVDATYLTDPPERPVVAGVDLGEETYDVDEASLLRIAREHVDLGGVVTASASLANPMSRRSAWDLDVEGAADLWDPTTEVGARWATSLTRLGNQLQRLEDEDVVVLFRPFHERNGGWFWWSALSDAAYAELWTRTRVVLEEERQLDNLLWVFGAAAAADGVGDVLSGWPGAENVDVVGLSAYGPHPDTLGVRGLDALRTTGLPTALTEVGPEFWAKPTVDGDDFVVIPELGVAYALFWHSWGSDAMALRDLPAADALFAEPDLLCVDGWQAPR